MKYLNLAFPTPEENLACDEALLENAEAGKSGEALRFWEPAQYFVVLGYSNKAESEVNMAFTEEKKIPILRRSSGGGTVLQGPGCLNYSLILEMDRAKELTNLVKTNGYILNKHEEALQPLLKNKIEVRGISDLAIDSMKFSGNAQRRKKNFLLYHGTFLLDMNLDLIEQVLRFPTKQPDYRKNRSHSDFLTNIDITAIKIKRALQNCWSAQENQ